MNDDWFEVLVALLDAGARQAMAGFGAPLATLGVTQDDWCRPDTVVQLGLPPNRIDVLTGISGVAQFEDAWASRVTISVRGRDVPVLGRAALVANKRAASRLKDLADLEALGERP